MSDIQGNNRYLALDGLRALAILLILSLHIVDNLYMTQGDGFTPLHSTYFLWFLMNGWVGVHLFFVLSGFLITGQLFRLEQSDNRKGDTLFFWKKRFFKIIPAYYLVLSLIFLSILIQHFPLSSQGLYHFLTQYVSHALFMHDTYPTRIGMNFVFWSLATEMKFYLLAPFIMMGLFSLRERLRVPIIISSLIMLLLVKIIIFVTGSGADNYLAFFMDIRRPFYMALDSLVIGMLCQFLWQNNNFREMASKRAVANFLLYGGIILALALMSFTIPYFEKTGAGLGYFQHTLFFTLISIAFGMALLGLIGGAKGHKIFEAPPLRWIALISYSLYLTHTFLVPPSIAWAQQILGPDVGSFLTWLYSFIILTGISSIPSFLLYYFVEKKFITWSRK